MIFQGLGFFFAWTWPLWAIAFVYFLVTAVSAAVREEADGKDRKSGLYTALAAVSLAVILGGTISLLAMAA